MYQPGGFIAPVRRTLPNAVHVGPTLSGEGSPETVVPANPGETYHDLLTDDLYLKLEGNQAVGWLLIGKHCGCGAGFAQQVYQSVGDPNGTILVNTSLPCICIDLLNNVIWTKTDGIIGNSGWGSP